MPDLNAELFDHPKKKDKYGKPQKWVRFSDNFSGGLRPTSTSQRCDHQRPATDEEIARLTPKPQPKGSK